MSFLLCTGLSRLDAGDARVLLQTLIFRCLLPLPVYFRIAARLMESVSVPKGRSRLLLILIPFAASLASLLSEYLLLG